MKKVSIFITIIMLILSISLAAEDYTIDGKLGVGNVDPVETLDVSGTVKGDAIKTELVYVTDSATGDNAILSPWSLEFSHDNSGTTYTTFMETTDGNKLDISFGPARNVRFIFDRYGFRIGSNTALLNQDGTYPLVVDGTILAKELQIKDATNWPDYVFTSNYKLKSLSEVEHYINQNGKLPEVPSELEVTRNGVNIGEMQTVLLKKIEELTLYMIDLEKQNSVLVNRVKQLEQRD